MDVKRFENSFDFLRLVGAVGVVYIHSYHLLNLKKTVPLTGILSGGIKFDVLFLGIFFTLSGYLIAQSVERSSSLKNYLWKRFLRVQPLLTTVCLVTLFVIGPVFSSLSVAEYFQNSNTWVYLKTIFPVFGIRFTLPGVFDQNIGENGVNGSLWTLIIEERVYLFMGLLFLVSSNRRLMFTIFVVSLNIVFLFSYFNVANTQLKVFNHYETQYYILFFNSALLFFLNVPFQKVNSFLVILFAMVAFIFVGNNIFSTLYFMPFLLLLIGSRKTIFSKVMQKGDITYGIYILSFPTQQILIQLSKNTIQPLALFCLTMLVCVPLAYLSWHFIEKRFLTLKNKIT